MDAVVVLVARDMRQLHREGDLRGRFGHERRGHLSLRLARFHLQRVRLDRAEIILRGEHHRRRRDRPLPRHVEQRRVGDQDVVAVAHRRQLVRGEGAVAVVLLLSVHHEAVAILPRGQLLQQVEARGVVVAEHLLFFPAVELALDVDRRDGESMPFEADQREVVRDAGLFHEGRGLRVVVGGDEVDEVLLAAHDVHQHLLQGRVMDLIQRIRGGGDALGREVLRDQAGLLVSRAHSRGGVEALHEHPAQQLAPSLPRGIREIRAEWIGIGAEDAGHLGAEVRVVDHAVGHEVAAQVSLHQTALDLREPLLQQDLLLHVVLMELLVFHVCLVVFLRGEDFFTLFTLELGRVGDAILRQRHLLRPVHRVLHQQLPRLHLLQSQLQEERDIGWGLELLLLLEVDFLLEAQLLLDTSSLRGRGRRGLQSLLEIGFPLIRRESSWS